MKQVTMIRTHDGILHETHGEGRRHLDKMYGNLLTGLAHKLVKAEKYGAIIDVLNGETETMRSMLIIKADMGLEPSEEES